MKTEGEENIRGLHSIRFFAFTFSSTRFKTHELGYIHYGPDSDGDYRVNELQSNGEWKDSEGILSLNTLAL